MTERDSPSLSRHVRVDLSQARIERLWQAAAPRLGERASTRVRLYVAVVVAVAAAVGLLFAWQRRLEPAATAWVGSSLETGADATSVTLTDGSKVEVQPGSRVDLGERSASAVRLELRRGRIACDVTHREGRSFVVAADGVEVRVVGTRFSVSTEHGRDGNRVEVRVERGVVEVRPAGGEHAERVAAGQSWSRETKVGAVPSAVPADAPPAHEISPAPALADTPADEATSTKAELPRAASTAAGRTHADSAKSSEASGSRALLEEARELWRSGKVQAAADAYQRLVRDYPSDARAGLAAFELGRLRMDRLGDMAGAARALEQAVALAPGSGFREDALARLVTASAAAHDLGGCSRARARYLAEFPHGVHQLRVTAACGAR